MKELNDKKIERSTKAQELLDLIQIKKEKELDADQLVRFNNLSQEVDELDNSIELLEREQKINLMIFNKDKNMENNEIKRYDLAKAIREFSNGRQLTGYEAEVQAEEVKRYKAMGETVNGILVPSNYIQRANEVTKSVGSSHISEVAGGLDIIADRSILEKLGVTVYDGLSNQIKLNFSNGFSASFVGEESGASQSVPTYGSDVLSARRMQGWQKFTAEYLSESSVMPSLVADMAASLDTGFAKAILDAIIADTGNTSMTGFLSTSTAAVLTWKNALALKGALKTANFMAPRYVAGGQLYAELEGTTRDTGSGRFVIENGNLGGYPVVDAQGILGVHDTNKYDLVFGDFRRAYVGYYSGIQLLVDPFSASDNGYVKITFMRLGDVAFNPSAFKVIANAKLA